MTIWTLLLSHNHRHWPHGEHLSFVDIFLIVWSLFSSNIVMKLRDNIPRLWFVSVFGIHVYMHPCVQVWMSEADVGFSVALKQGLFSITWRLCLSYTSWLVNHCSCFPHLSPSWGYTEGAAMPLLWRDGKLNWPSLDYMAPSALAVSSAYLS